jgi:hypothetical protein
MGVPVTKALTLRPAPVMVSKAKIGHPAGKVNGNFRCFCGGNSLFLLRSKNGFLMDTSGNLREVYQSPALRVVPVQVGNAICGSPLPGGSEDIGYEDWD